MKTLSIARRDPIPPMETVLGPWFCDHCDEIIEHVDDGWLQWWTGPNPGGSPHRGFGVRIVHHLSASPTKHDGEGCYYRDGERGRDFDRADHHLRLFTGVDGFAQIFWRGSNWSQEETAVIVQRLYVPGYETARRYAAAAADAGASNDSTRICLFC
jgi:hypothetical protein